MVGRHVSCFATWDADISRVWTLWCNGSLWKQSNFVCRISPMVTWWQTAENLHWPDDEYVSFFFASKIHNYYNCAIILLPCCWHWMIRMDTHFYFLSSVELMNILLCSLTLVLQTPEIELDLICGMTVLFARLDAELYARSKYHHLPRALLCLTQLQYHPTFFDHWRCKSSCVWHSFTFLIWIWMSQLLRILILLKSDF